MDARPIDANALADKIKRWSKRLNPGFYRSDVLICDALVCVQEYISDSSTLDYVPCQQWISVKDRLPKSPGDVLVVLYGRVCIAWYCGGEQFETGSGLICYAEEVTHWMPLPELPKEES